MKSPHKEKIIKKKLKNYYKAKLQATLHLLNAYKSSSFPSVILRLYQAYGKKQEINRLIPIVIKSCLKNKKFACTNGLQIRDFVHVDDVVSAIFKTIEKRKIAIGEVFNIGSGKPTSVINIIKKIRNIIGQGTPEFGKIKLRKDERNNTFPSIKKANKLLKWRPKVKFSNGIISTINSYKYL